MQVSEKTTKNSERLGRQVRLGFEPGTSRLSVLSVSTPPLDIKERKRNIQERRLRRTFKKLKFIKRQKISLLIIFISFLVYLFSIKVGIEFHRQFVSK